jgi:hypothetical protein
MCDVLERYLDGRINESLNEVAKNQLRDKFPVELVVRHTGLDMKTVKRLKIEVDNE